VSHDEQYFKEDLKKDSSAQEKNAFGGLSSVLSVGSVFGLRLTVPDRWLRAP
jgi:hypothetical protein